MRQLTRTSIMFWSLFLLGFSIMSQGNQSFEEFLQQLAAEIEEEAKGEVVKAPPRPLKPIPQKKPVVIEEKPADPQTNFLRPFRVTTAPKEAPLPPLPPFKKDALVMFLSKITRALASIDQKIASFPQTTRKKFEQYHQRESDVKKNIEIILSKTQYRHALYDPTFDQLRKKIVDVGRELERSEQTLSLQEERAATLSKPKKRLHSSRRVSEEKPNDSNDSYTLLGVKKDASPSEILGVQPEASREEVVKAYRALFNAWSPKKHAGREQQAKAVQQLIQNTYDEIMLAGFPLEVELSAQTKHALEKIKNVFDRELGPLGMQLQKVIEFAKKPIEEKRKIREKAQKEAAEHLKRLERIRPRPIPRVEGYGYPYRAPYRRPHDYGYGYGYGPAAYPGAPYAAPEAYEYPREEVAEKPEERPTDKRKAEPDKKPPTEKEKKKILEQRRISTKYREEQNLKKKIIELVDKLEKEKQNIPAAEKLIKEIGTRIKKLEKVQLALSEARTKRKDWQDLDKKYQAARSRFKKTKQDISAKKEVKPEERPPKKPRIPIQEAQRKIRSFQTRYRNALRLPRTQRVQKMRQLRKLQREIKGEKIRNYTPQQGEEIKDLLRKIGNVLAPSAPAPVARPGAPLAPPVGRPLPPPGPPPVPILAPPAPPEDEI